MIIFRKALIRFCVYTPVVRTLVIMMAMLFVSWAVPPPESPPNVWYTQIGLWHLRQKDSLSGKSFLFHDSRIDGARSGQATANIRLNFNFRDISRCEAIFSLGPAPSSAGLLVQNKQATYYFLAQKEATSDSLRAERYCNGRIISLSSAAANVSDTTRLTLFIKEDSLYFGTHRTTIAIVKPPDFPRLTTVGFECPSGSVKVFDVRIEARNALVTEAFDKATLINLHLDKMLSSGVIKRSTDR